MIVRHTHRFSAAHRVQTLPASHKCSRLHGHNYTVIVEAEGPIDPVIGWVVDFGFLRAACESVIGPLDHSCLNDHIENTTCEGVAQWIAERINVTSLIQGGRRLRRVIVSEGGPSEAEWSAAETTAPTTQARAGAAAKGSE